MYLSKQEHVHFQQINGKSVFFVILFVCIETKLVPGLCNLIAQSAFIVFSEQPESS